MLSRSHRSRSTRNSSIVIRFRRFDKIHVNFSTVNDEHRDRDGEVGGSWVAPSEVCARELIFHLNKFKVAEKL